MEFKNFVDKVGKSRYSEKRKVSTILKYIEKVYNYASRPVKASYAKKYLLENNLISKNAAENLNFKDISIDLTEKRNKKLEEQKPIEVKSEVLDKLLEYKNSNSEAELAIYLLLVSGLRVNELLNNEFHKVKNTLYIKRLSKRKDNKENFPIKLLFVYPSEFIKLYEKFKTLNNL